MNKVISSSVKAWYFAVKVGKPKSFIIFGLLEFYVGVYLIYMNPFNVENMKSIFKSLGWHAWSWEIDDDSFFDHACLVKEGILIDYIDRQICDIKDTQ